jgi:NAD(P)-dependent dehydrogenase (short-subunit alcohol dehydrogenase family)
MAAEMKALAMRTIMVTGACGGIGSATAVRLAGAGANIVATDLMPTAADLLKGIEDAGGRAIYVQADISKEEQVEAVVFEATRAFGKLDGAFNNAGVEQVAVPLHEITPQQWRRAIEIDLTGVFLCLKYQIRTMLTSGGGSIVNTASSLGMVAVPNACEYVAAKHGVVGLTKAAAVDYGVRNIRVNAVLPGGVRTPMVLRAMEIPGFPAIYEKLQARHAMGRFGETHEIAEAVAWLLSDAASFVTGAAMAIDGGFLAR